MCCHVGRVMKPGANSRAKVTAMSALHIHPQCTLQRAYSTFSATDFHCKWLFLNVSGLNASLTGKIVYIIDFIVLSKIMEAVIYTLPPWFCYRRGLQPINLSLYACTVACAYGAWRGGFTPTGTGLLAGSLMGYGPRLHLFQWISLFGSARQGHVSDGGREVMGR